MRGHSQSLNGYLMMSITKRVFKRLFSSDLLFNSNILYLSWQPINKPLIIDFNGGEIYYYLMSIKNNMFTILDVLKLIFVAEMVYGINNILNKV